MALIQIRDVPEDVYETIRRRARRAGQSIQAYMLSRTIEMSRHPTPEEVLAELDADLAGRQPLAVDVDALLADRDADRPG
ncbi:MAG: antitoxin [Actinomycetota bacterium]|nr:antitoxin [Actinomycetota bacterium]